ncbi:hypothetical protein D9M68_975100 [compost metagenome]
MLLSFFTLFCRDSGRNKHEDFSYRLRLLPQHYSVSANDYRTINNASYVKYNLYIVNYFIRSVNISIRTKRIVVSY